MLFIHFALIVIVFDVSVDICWFVIGKGWDREGNRKVRVVAATATKTVL